MYEKKKKNSHGNSKMIFHKCNMLRDCTWTEYEEAMSDEHPLKQILYSLLI